MCADAKGNDVDERNVWVQTGSVGTKIAKETAIAFAKTIIQHFDDLGSNVDTLEFGMGLRGTTQALAFVEECKSNGKNYLILI